jgi:hypothetical protein
VCVGGAVRHTRRKHARATNGLPHWGILRLKPGKWRACLPGFFFVADAGHCRPGARANSAAVLKRMHRIFGRDWNLVSVKLTCADRFSPAHWEGKMKFFGAALVYLAVLYGVDAFFFDGQYGHSLDSAISDIQRRW